MEKESNISLGGDIILLALFPQTIYLLHENWSVFKQQMKEKNTVCKFVCERRRKNTEALKMCVCVR